MSSTCSRLAWSKPTTTRGSGICCGPVLRLAAPAGPMSRLTGVATVPRTTVGLSGRGAVDDGTNQRRRPWCTPLVVTSSWWPDVTSTVSPTRTRLPSAVLASAERTDTKPSLGSSSSGPMRAGSAVARGPFDRRCGPVPATMAYDVPGGRGQRVEGLQRGVPVDAERGQAGHRAGTVVEHVDEHRRDPAREVGRQGTCSEEPVHEVHQPCGVGERRAGVRCPDRDQLVDGQARVRLAFGELARDQPAATEANDIEHDWSLQLRQQRAEGLRVLARFDGQAAVVVAHHAPLVAVGQVLVEPFVQGPEIEVRAAEPIVDEQQRGPDAQAGEPVAVDAHVPEVPVAIRTTEPTQLIAAMVTFPGGCGQTPPTGTDDTNEAPAVVDPRATVECGEGRGTGHLVDELPDDARAAGTPPSPTGRRHARRVRPP